MKNKLKYTFRAVNEIQKRGISFFETTGENFQEIETLLVFYWAGQLHQNPKLQLDKVKKDFENEEFLPAFSTITKDIGEALKQSLPNQEDAN